MTTLFVVGLPHTKVNKDYTLCAYTSKHYKFCNMMKSYYNIVSLASDQSTCHADEHVNIYPQEDQEKWFGNHDYKSKFFNITWNPRDEHWVTGNARAIEEIKKRYQPNDIICLIGGVCQKQIAEAFSDAIIVEYGIGYEGVFADFKVFESYSHMHYVYGKLNIPNGIWYDQVIPNYFEPDDFTLSEKEDYFLYIGRIIQRKGVEIAVEVSKRLDKKLILAGQGVIESGPGYILAEDGMKYEGNIEYIGSVNAEERKELMAKAKVAFTPTLYIEPFGGVAVEAMLSGTPVVASDFGAFTETVIPGVSGYRFRTIHEAVKAAELSQKLDPYSIRRFALDNFSTENVKKMYKDYFDQLIDLHTGGGFYSNRLETNIFRYGVYY